MSIPPLISKQLHSLLFLTSLLMVSSLSHAELTDQLNACSACHGKEGRASSEGYYPRIAGKPEGYLYNQLINFKEGRRNSSSMGYLVANLPDAYLKDIASYFAEQHIPYPPPQRTAIDAKTYQRGMQLVTQGDKSKQLPACNSCHGTQMTGMKPSIPGLVGLPRDYLNAQLGAWINGSRKAAEPDCMGQIVKSLNGDDLSAITAYLSVQPVDYTKPIPSHLTATLPVTCGSAASKNKS